jgi:hypothetical protein
MQMKVVDAARRYNDEQEGSVNNSFICIRRRRGGSDDVCLDLTYILKNVPVREERRTTLSICIIRNLPPIMLPDNSS